MCIGFGPTWIWSASSWQYGEFVTYDCLYRVLWVCLCNVLGCGETLEAGCPCTRRADATVLVRLLYFSFFLVGLQSGHVDGSCRPSARGGKADGCCWKKKYHVSCRSLILNCWDLLWYLSDDLKRKRNHVQVKSALLVPPLMTLCHPPPKIYLYGDQVLFDVYCLPSPPLNLTVFTFLATVIHVWERTICEIAELKM